MAITLTQPTLNRKLVACGNDEVWYEMPAGTMVELAAANGDIDCTDELNMFEAFQKVFIVNGTNLKIADFVNTKLTVTALTTAPTRGAIVTQANTNAQMVVDFVNTAKTEIYGKTITATAFNTTAGNTLSGGSMDPETRVPSAVAEATTTPHWYDYTVYPDGASGSLPTHAYLGCLYRGRVVLSGHPNYPHQWYMSRQADHTDYAYTANDAQSPVAGGNADAGEVGDIVRALVPYKDDYLIFGCANSVWVLRGDPAIGGSLDEVDLTVGMHGANSWCFDSNGNLYFWGTGGVYRVKRDFTGVENMSRVALPELLTDENPDPSTHRVTMAYDSKRQGITICITKLSDGTSSNYFYDLILGGFYPESYPTVCGAYSSFYYRATDDTYSGLVLGCTDGYIRVFDDAAKDDDSGGSDTAISSYVLYPVAALSEEPDHDGKVTSLVITTSGGASGGAHSDTDGLTVDLFKGNNAELVVEDVKDGATSFTSVTLSGTGRQNKIKPRLRGAFMGIKLSNSTASETWAVERILYDVKPAGRV
jgi:hypothetical protein